MKSIAFPKMFNSTSTNVVEGREATVSNLRLLLTAEKNEMLGDPYFGISLKKYIFEQNNLVLQDMLIDDIYTALALFMPQLSLTRNDITLTYNKTTLMCTIKATNQLDFVTDMYNLVLLEENQ